MKVRTYRRLDARDVTVHRGIPVTTVARTLVDLTDILDAEELTNVIKEAAFRQRFDLAATRQALSRANGRHKLHVLEEALTLYAQGSAGLKSGKERAFRGLARRAGLPQPRTNVHVEGFEVDCLWPDRALVAEVDGPGHERPSARREDALRDRLLTAAGYTVLRFTDVEIDQRPDLVVRRLKAYV